jgi:hypothetical protein
LSFELLVVAAIVPQRDAIRQQVADFHLEPVRPGRLVAFRRREDAIDEVGMHDRVLSDPLHRGNGRIRLLEASPVDFQNVQL